MGKRKYKPSRKDTMLDNLHKVIRRGIQEDKAQCQAILNFYIRNRYIATNMKQKAALIIRNNWEIIKPKPIKGSFHLYAVSDGEYVKIGVSKNHKDRIKKMQTGSSKHLSLIWTCFVANDSREGLRQEKKLHRALSKYHIRGEWFDPGCMRIVDGWTIKNRDSLEQKKGIKENQDLDEEFRLILGD